MKRAIFRVDAGVQMGLGHLIRCTAFAEMLQPFFSVQFFLRGPITETQQKILTSLNISYSPLSPLESIDEATQFANHLNSEDIVILDGYHFDIQYQKTIQATGAKLVYIDDLVKGPYAADLIINSAPGVTREDYALPSEIATLLGLSYVLLRSPFLKAASKRVPPKQNGSVFINMGGSDAHNLTQKIVAAALPIASIKELKILVGPLYPFKDALVTLCNEHLKPITIYDSLGANEVKEVLEECQLAVCPASSICLEAIAVGISIVSGFSADNQRHLLKGLEDSGSILNIGDFHQMEAVALGAAMEQLLSSKQLIEKQFISQKLAIDGKSGERLVNFLLALN